MNYSKFRDSDNYTAVSVNHRALITRTLTKYPVDYALFRELLQNSADAKANSAIITFESDSPVDPLQPATLHAAKINKLVFRNNGLVFSDDDWSRLKEIAKGNPDETKIGAFGVGFYSVFELTDTPLVHSGNLVMSFHFVGDELRYSQVRADEYIHGTLIDIPYRKSQSQMPDLTTFIVFLTQSFMLLPLNQIQLNLNSLQLFQIVKVESPPQVMSMPAKLNIYSLNKFFKLNPPTISQLQVDISYLNATQMKKADLKSAAGIFSFGKKMVSSFFTTSENPTETTKLVCFLRRVDASAQVRVSDSFKRRMTETVLKPPAKTTNMSLLTYNKTDMENSTLKSPLSDCVFPVDFNDAKLVIGFHTKQSTGIKTHIALNQLIPTMERTAVDMSNATVKDWNRELLYCAGILARCVYEYELQNSSSEKDLTAQLAYAGYTMKRFEMGASAPDATVGQMVAAGFWRSCEIVAVPTQLGIQPSTKVRLPGNTPLSLLRNTPVLSTHIGVEGTNAFIDQIKQVGYVRDLSTLDLAQDLQVSPINASQFHDLVEWGKLSRSELAVVSKAVVVTDEDASISGVILGQIKYYQNRFLIPEGMPLPSSCLPANLVLRHRTDDLARFGWSELPFSVWVEYIVSLSKKEGDFNMVVNEKFACQVLSVLSDSWSSKISREEKVKIADLLAPVNCIPTQLGMQLPGESYLKQIALFPKLPVIIETVQASKSFLSDINVRESVDMKFVLRVLHDPESKLTWSSEDLVSYLSDNSSGFKQSDWAVLKQGMFFQDTQSSDLTSVSTLYGPSRSLEILGFHTLKWTGQWRNDSKHAKLLYKLGLKHAPSAIALFEQGIKKNAIKEALQYYLAKYEENHYSSGDLAATNFKIIPLLNGGYSAPKDCYFDMEVSLFGLDVISRRFEEFQSQRLGVPLRPPASVMIDRLLASPPKTMREADPLFSYLSTRISSFSSSDVARCASAKFIPVKISVWESPNDVFFSGADSHLNSLFHIIRPAELSIPFLRKVGVEEFPSISQIAWKVVQDPTRVYEAFGSSIRYKELLIKFQTEWARLKIDSPLMGRMKVSPFLVGETYDEESENTSVRLCAASDISIVDNVIILNQFKHLITACPQEAILENFYLKLGAEPLSSSLMQRASLGKVITNENSDAVRQQIVDRLILFLESTSKERRIKSRQLENLKLVFVSQIKLDRKLNNTPVISSYVSAYMAPNESDVLYLTVNPDWFDVSGVLARYALRKPDPESVIVLELQLSSSLESLQRKGYNVNRLLKRQRDAEDAKYLEQVRIKNLQKEEEKQRQIQAAEKRKSAEAERAQSAKSADARLSHYGAQNNMTREEQPLLDRQKDDIASMVPSMAGAKLPNAPVKGFLNSLLDKASSSMKPSQQQQLEIEPDTQLRQQRSLQQHNNRPGSWTPPPAQQAQSASGDGGTSVAPSPQTLESGVSTSRPFSQDSINTPQHVERPRAPMPVACTPQRIYDYKVGVKLSDGLRVFVKSGALAPTNYQVDCALEFRPILQKCAEIYRVRWDAVSVYIGELQSIAFNTGGSLFFNLDVFITRKQSNGWHMPKQLDFWFTVMAHELAHNLVADHGEQHSFYTEFYIQEYMAKLRQIQ